LVKWELKVVLMPKIKRVKQEIEEQLDPLETTGLEDQEYLKKKKETKV
jgi:hypothetical protein